MNCAGRYYGGVVGSDLLALGQQPGCLQKKDGCVVCRSGYRPVLMRRLGAAYRSDDLGSFEGGSGVVVGGMA